MTLKDLLKMCNCPMYIRQELELGVSGSAPVMYYHPLMNSIPEEIQEREVKSFRPAPMEQYGRPDACLTVNLWGFNKDHII